MGLCVAILLLLLLFLPHQTDGGVWHSFNSYTCLLFKNRLNSSERSRAHKLVLIKGVQMIYKYLYECFRDKQPARWKEEMTTYIYIWLAFETIWYIKACKIWQCAFALDIIGMACDIIFRSGSCALISNTAKLKGKFAFEDCFDDWPPRETFLINSYWQCARTCIDGMFLF